MNTLTNETYKGWTVAITSGKNLCSNFSFDITSPSGQHHHVALGGDSEQRARERAKEMIDLESALTGEE